MSKRLAKWVTTTTTTTTTTNRRQQKLVPRAAAAYGRQLKIKVTKGMRIIGKVGHKTFLNGFVQFVLSITVMLVIVEGRCKPNYYESACAPSTQVKLNHLQFQELRRSAQRRHCAMAAFIFTKCVTSASFSYGYITGRERKKI